MFEIPNSKRVRRDELYDSSSEDGSNGQGDATRQDDAEDQEVRAKLNERLSRLLGLDLSNAEPASAGQQSHPPATADTQVQDNAEEHEDKHEEEFEFRLFSTSAKATAPTKVILAASDDEDADLGEGAFTVPERPLEYYVVGEPTREELERYRYSAVAGEDIVLGARKRAWGLERPWRVVKITAKAGTGLDATSSSNPKSKDESEQGQKEKRKRPGKKRRIAMRIKTKADKAKREVEEKSKLSKEEHLSDKKKRLNRERKLKRRAKEREKKMASKGEDGTQQASADAADSGSDSGSD